MNDEMKLKIIEELQKIEETEDVKIIMSVESGSRAWGFASPDSDYDVRFIYVRKEADYLRLDRVRDVIEWRLDTVFDISGWDVKKSLQLLYHANPTIMEWCVSPIVYTETEEAEWIKQIQPHYFSAKKSLFHYWHMADSNYRNYLKGDEVQLKKYLYVLRPLLAAQWILDKQSCPPVRFDELLDAELEDEMRPAVHRLLEIKKNVPEMETVPKIGIINEYAERKLEEIKGVAKNMDDMATKWQPLNQLFLNIVNDQDFVK
ncbi:nucleotidyltransferase domain-containing protein [Faecalicoccus pleomorphus]|uniref:nucleotidyltransferase domain-containing protein n=1 Tax=Faecalicoccus pleomorphus TaxID=1323 RepID=UPI0026EB5133|nr:nucleotidyltransferase domain-containing protein [Faecalicoccus pleomorphus]